MKIIDNNTETLKENLISSIQSGSKLSIAASCFSMYAFNELIKQFSELEEFRFVFTTPSFVKSIISCATEGIWSRLYDCNKSVDSFEIYAIEGAKLGIRMSEINQERIS